MNLLQILGVLEGLFFAKVGVLTGSFCLNNRKGLAVPKQYIIGKLVAGIRCWQFFRSVHNTSLQPSHFCLFPPKFTGQRTTVPALF